MSNLPNALLHIIVTEAIQIIIDEYIYKLLKGEVKDFSEFTLPKNICITPLFNIEKGEVNGEDFSLNVDFKNGKKAKVACITAGLKELINDSTLTFRQKHFADISVN